jgi:3',5'-cyclic AMP phosphodiesterase CpdA
MIIAQITDLHVAATGLPPGPDAEGAANAQNGARLAATIDHINRLSPRPDAVIVTGDLADGPRPGEYEELAGHLPRLDMPVFAVPGNHDDRDAMRRLFAGAPWLSPTGFLHHVIDRGPLRIVMLDTLDPGRTAGILCAERLGWLKDRLDEHPGPVVVALHHPPFQVGVPFMDAVALDSPQALEDIVRRHANVLAVVCGHVHRSATVSFAGTVGIAVPAVGHQLALEIGRTEFPRWTLEPPVVALHLWTPGGGLVSHLSPVGPWAPRPFRRGT